MRTTLLIAAGLAVLGLAACGKPAEKAPAPGASTSAAAAAPGKASGGDGGFRTPDRQTLELMQQRTRARFDTVDTDKDGKITPEEIEAAMAAREAQGDGQSGGAGGGRRGGGGINMLARADKDSDGVVTVAEVEAQTKARFEELDADHNGVVTREEMRAAFAGRREGRQGQ